MMKRAIRDTTPSGITMQCALCPHWYAFAFTPEAAEESEIRHERLVHPTSFTVRKRASNRAWWARHSGSPTRK